MQEQREPFVVLSAYTQMDLVKLIEITYKSSATHQIAAAQQLLMKYLVSNQFVERLFNLLQNDQNPDEKFKTAVANLIKKFSYQYSKKEGENKIAFIQKIFFLLTEKANVSPKNKQLLGVALEYVMNHDEICQYKPKVILKLIDMFKGNHNQDSLLGLTIIAVACLNSLIQVHQQLELFTQLKDGIAMNLAKILDYIKSFNSQNFPFQAKKVFDLCKRIFDFIQLAVSRIVEEEDGIEDSVNNLRKDQTFVDIYYQFLVLFNNDKSIISKSAPQINPIKEIIVELIFQLYKNFQMPENLFNLFFLTFLLESSIVEYDDVEEHIVCRVIQILQKYLNLEYYAQVFEEHKLQILISLLMYSATKPEQLQLIQDQPQKFVQISHQYTQAFASSLIIKVRAACFLKVYAMKIDSSLRNILQIVVIIITAALQAGDSQSPCKQLYNNIKSQFPKFPFFQLNLQYQLETCFMMLSVVSPLVNRRQDLQKVVYALLITHMQALSTMTNHLALLRLIRLISYYPTAVYYTFIKMKMNNGRVFFLEGLQAFQRILKLNKYPQIFQLLAQIFSQISSSINISDPIFQIILLNHYERMLKASLPLFHVFMTKLRDGFIQNADKKQHFAILSLSYIESLIRKQKQASFRKQILVYFYSMEDYLIKLLDFYKQKKQKKIGDQRQVNRMINIFETYQDKVTQIYCVIAKLQTHVSQKSLNFALNSLSRLNQYHKNSSIFQFYNNLLLKVDREMSKSKPFYNAFIQQIKQIFLNPQQPSKNVQLLPNLALLTSLILSCFSEVGLSVQDMIFLLKTADLVEQQNRQYLLAIVLTYTHVQPAKIRNALIQNNIYQNVLKVILTTNYKQKIFKKIFLIAMVTLLQIQDLYFEDIVKKCIQYFKEQSALISKNIKKIPQIDPKLRRYFHEHPEEEQQCMEEQVYKQKANSNLGLFHKLKHPIQALSEYDQFKIRIWQNMNVVQKLNQEQKTQLRQILQCDWVGQSLRKIVSVKNNQSTKYYI